jgi:FKBP-type peptidyl-prolyl cis-trans isomerase
MKSWCVWLGSGMVVALAASGCEDPGAIVPTTPPGAVIPKTSPDTEPAAAQGEMPAPIHKAQDRAELAAKFPPAPPTAKGEVKKTKGGVAYETIKEGIGAELAAGQRATFHYVGSLENGEVFDSTRKRQQPMLFQIGVDLLIAGWGEAIPGMKVGEIRKLVIPPEMGYGAKGKPPTIPPNSTLHFEIELVGILPDKG